MAFKSEEEQRCVQRAREVSQVREEGEEDREQAEGTHPGIRLARLEFPRSSKTDD